MSGIAKAGEKMKKKISFGDYGLSNEVTKLQEKITKPVARKIYEISQKDFKILEEIFQMRRELQKPASHSELMSEAIHLLHQLHL